MANEVVYSGLGDLRLAKILNNEIQLLLASACRFLGSPSPAACRSRPRVAFAMGPRLWPSVFVPLVLASISPVVLKSGCMLAGALLIKAG